MSRIPLVLDCDPGHDDAVAVAHLAVPDLVQTVPYRVDVETTSELTRGRTVVDLHGLTELPPNAEVGVAIDRPLRYVALGDSYTIGTSVDSAERWPDLLVGALRSAPPTLRLVANLGVNGYTTQDLIRDELPALSALQPEFVSLLIGVNDVVQGVSPATYETNVATILDALLVHVPADRIFSMAIPDYTVTPAGADYGDPRRQHDGIVACNAVMARLAADRNVAYVDTFDISVRAAGDRSLVADDGLHPSGRQYAAWVDRILPVVERLLGPPDISAAGS